MKAKISCWASAWVWYWRWMDELGLQGREEALHRGVVEAIGLATHRCGYAGARQSVAIGT